MQFFALLNGRPTIFQGLFVGGSNSFPSISFADDQDTGFYTSSAFPNTIWVTSGGGNALRFSGNQGGSGFIYNGGNNNYIQFDYAGFISLNAAGTNQNIILNPTGDVAGGVLTISRPSATSQTRATLNYTTAEISLLVGAGFCGLQAGTGLGLIFYTNNAESARFLSNGELLLGVTISGNNGRLQLATHTTAAGGIGFGTDTSLYRATTGALILTDNTARLLIWARSSAGVCEIGSQTAHDLVFRANNLNALTIDTSQNSTFTGTAITAASAAAKAGLRLPHGAAPTAPVNGDIWTTTAGLYVRINGATVGPLT